MLRQEIGDDADGRGKEIEPRRARRSRRFNNYFAPFAYFAVQSFSHILPLLSAFSALAAGLPPAGVPFVEPPESQELMDEEEFFKRSRLRMVEEQIQSRGIRDQRLLETLRSVPRHLFVNLEDRRYAYNDGPLPIGLGQTISQPYIVALMTELLQLKGSETVLEVGTGSGYQAAVLANLARQVHTIERHTELAQYAGRLFKDLQISNIQVHIGDGSLGLPEFSPYDGILVTAAAPAVASPLLEQLTESGRLVLPVGSRYGQVLECWQRRGEGFTHETITAVAFVPLIGQAGFKG
jgi:protein-L-isoaspartate(D-aspartate) O-methyltransferase